MLQFALERQVNVESNKVLSCDFSVYVSVCLNHHMFTIFRSKLKKYVTERSMINREKP